jgi:hypothetical protein
MLREERGMAFALGAIRRGLEVGGRWERIGVESAHELRWNAEVEVAEALLNTTRIAQINGWSRKKEIRKRKVEEGLLESVNKRKGLTSKEEGADRGSGWDGNTRQKVGFTHCGGVIDGQVDTR